MAKTSLIQLKGTVLKAVQQAGFDVSEDDLHLERTKTLEHGHFATNIALLLAGKLGKRPQEVAQVVASWLEKEDLVTKAEVAGPGFVNLWIEQNFYSTILKEMVGDLSDYLKEDIGHRKSDIGNRVMVIDYSHPNIAKPMGVHHLLSTIIGDSIKKIYQHRGWKVIADNFIGDMGTQFGKLIHAIKQWGDLSEIEKDPIPALQKLYIQYHIEADKDVELDEEARAEYKKFEEGDKESRQLWEKIVKWSLMEIQPVYDRLGITFDHMNGESFYEDKMQMILEQGRKSGVIVDGEKGAWIIKPDDPEDVPAVVRKSDGATLYITRDLARIKYWETEWHPTLMVNVVDAAQKFHFRKLFEAARKLNLTTAAQVHVDFGRMRFKDGSMSTRKGNIVRLNEVLDEAEKRSLALINEKGAELSDAEKKALSRIMGVGAVKYSILHQNRVSDMTFDWDQMLSLEGNSAPYLMYTVARAKSIVRKADISLSDTGDYELQLSDDLETKVILDLLQYSEALERAAEEYKPNHIANCLYQLAQDFNTLYNALPVIQAEEPIRKSRLLITGAVIRIMEDAFGLLGLSVPEKM
ncbi:arginine--tRNA ligase [Candidatus Peregrinibacteria bacterium]|nr:arginine--tRNA ligase [Candidatus Peregrinibacteria bacterium]